MTATSLLAAARLAHFAACFLMLSLCVFDRFIVVAEYRPSIPMRSMMIAAGAALLSGAAWFAMIAIQMSGLPPGEALGIENLRMVWSQTQFGSLWEWRLIAWYAAAQTAMFFCICHGTRFRNTLVWLCLIFSALLVFGLAWAGHGQTGSAPGLHLAADGLHLLAAAIWPTSLLPMLWMLGRLRRDSDPAKWLRTSIMVRRFSLMALASVAVLTLTGLVNYLFLVGSIANLFGTTYGRLLLAKISLFALMVAIGRVNLLSLKPRLIADSPDEMAAARLRRNVMAEFILGSIVMIIVAFLGLLPPALE